MEIHRVPTSTTAQPSEACGQVMLIPPGSDEIHRNHERFAFARRLRQTCREANANPATQTGGFAEAITDRAGARDVEANASQRMAFTQS